jgi:hypothetical protein
MEKGFDVLGFHRCSEVVCTAPVLNGALYYA